VDLVFLPGPAASGKLTRSEFHKLTSVETLRRLRNDDPEVEQPPADLVIDTDRNDAARSAESIAEHSGLVPQPYPG
jgi:hypothetical protein